MIDNLLPGGFSSLYPWLPIKSNYTRPTVLVTNADTFVNTAIEETHNMFIVVMTLLVLFFLTFHVYSNIRMCLDKKSEPEEELSDEVASTYVHGEMHLQSLRSNRLRQLGSGSN